MNFFSWMFIKNRLLALRYLMADKSVPKRKKALVIFGIIYLFMPFDLIPAVIFPFAWMDDLLLWIYIIYNLKDYLDVYWLGEKPVDLKKEFKSKEIIDDADFTVDENGKSDINSKGEDSKFTDTNNQNDNEDND